MEILKEKDTSTEQKILQAARVVFAQKGYAAARTRDIAIEANINLALLNYYFRSKEKLFKMVMLEKVQLLFGTMEPIISDKTTDLFTKINLFAAKYIELLLANPDLPIFVLSEIRKDVHSFTQNMPLLQTLKSSSFFHQLAQLKTGIQPMHLMMNMMGMLIVPFIMRPAFNDVGIIDNAQFHKMMRERIEYIPIWFKSILSTNLPNTNHEIDNV